MPMKLAAPPRLAAMARRSPQNQQRTLSQHLKMVQSLLQTAAANRMPLLHVSHRAEFSLSTRTDDKAASLEPIALPEAKAIPKDSGA